MLVQIVVSISQDKEIDFSILYNHIQIIPFLFLWNNIYFYWFWINENPYFLFFLRKLNLIYKSKKMIVF